MSKATIGERLRMIRQRHNFKLLEVGKIFDISVQTLSRYEKNQRTPDNDFLYAFGKHFNLSGDWLLYGEPPIYKSDIDRNVKESFLELSHLLTTAEVPGISAVEKLLFEIEKLTDDTPENYLVLLKYMMKYPLIRRSILQNFCLFLKPLLDKYPELAE